MLHREEGEIANILVRIFRRFFLKFQNFVKLKKNGAKTFKSDDMNYKVFFEIRDIYEAMFQRKIKRVKFKSAEYSLQRRSLVDYIYMCGQTFNISENTVQLGIFLLDLVMMK